MMAGQECAKIKKILLGRCCTSVTNKNVKSLCHFMFIESRLLPALYDQILTLSRSHALTLSRSHALLTSHVSRKEINVKL